MDSYLKTQVMLFRKSFRIKGFSIAFALQLAKYILFSLIIMGFISFMVKLFASMKPFLEIIDKIKVQGITGELAMQFVSTKHMFDTFFIRLGVLIIVTFVLLVMLYAIFDSLIISRLRGQRINLRRLFHMILAYLVISLLFFILTALSLYYINDMYWLVLVWTVIFALYLLIIRMFQISWQEDALFSKNIHGMLRHLGSLGRYLPPILIMTLIGMAIIFFVLLLSLLIGMYAFMIGALVFIAYTVWTINYFDKSFTYPRKAH